MCPYQINNECVRLRKICQPLQRGCVLDGKVACIESQLDGGNKNELKGEVGKVEQYRCIVCGYIYIPEISDPDHGIRSGASFRNLPDTWVCPECGAPKEQFEVI